ncbi:MAG: OmpH family outer membrane protein [Prevotellaceae bacterium]|nr:OmpH family outer membrane protein [Prevotellaceae bacterium]
MKKLILIFTLMLLPLLASAQQFRFGYFSMEKVLPQVAGYTMARHQVDQLSQQYANELKRAEDEFNAKYEDFLTTQSTLAPSIRDKRQAELKDLLTKNMAFKEQSQKLLEQSEKAAMAPLRQKVYSALARIGEQQGLAFIINNDRGTLPYINAQNGVDVTDQLLSILK